jgi:hypothetical protein
MRFCMGMWSCKIHGLKSRASIKARSSSLHRHSGNASGDACYNVLAQNGLCIVTVAMQFWAAERARALVPENEIPRLVAH